METPRKIKGLWTIAMVELTNACNFSCEFCPSDFLKRKKTSMPAELWKKILSELGEKKMTDTVFFHLLGEPLLHKDVFEAIRFANSKGLSVSFYTNGALLDEDTGNKLLDSLENGRIVLSLQNVLPDNFAKRCRGFISYEEYIDRLQKFTLKAQSRGKTIQVHCMVDILRMGWNFKKTIKEQQLIQAVYYQWAKTLKTKKTRRINTLNPAASYPLGKTSSFFVKHLSLWSNQFISAETMVTPNDRGFCALMSDTFGILSDGTCTFCCNDYEGKLNLGNAWDSSLEDIFYGEKTTRIREAVNKGIMIEDLCKMCRGKLIYKKNHRQVPSRNLLSESYFFMEHFKRYGLKSVVRKSLENIQRRMTKVKQ